jgi:hypothetical protein
LVAKIENGQDAVNVASPFRRPFANGGVGNAACAPAQKKLASNAANREYLRRRLRVRWSRERDSAATMLVAP